MEGDDLTGRRQEEQKLPDLFFVLTAVDVVVRGFDVYAVETTTDKPSIRKLFNFKPTDPKVESGDLGTAVCGSKLCVVGGAYDFTLNKFSREFMVFNLKNWKTKKNFKPPQNTPPKPNGAKPFPAVFAVDGRLYALADMRLSSSMLEIPDPAFEVYDGRSWKSIETPFKKIYSDKSCYLRGYKVVNKKLYVVLSNQSRTDDDIYYSYSPEVDKWDTIILNTGDTLQTNLTLYAHYSRWEAKEDFDGDLMAFHVSRTRVLAHDLKAKVDSRRIRCNHSACPYDHEFSDYPMSAEEEYPFLRVHGLEHINELGGVPSASAGFVAHLAGNIFCVVYSFTDSKEKHHLHACKFELHKQTGGGGGEHSTAVNLLQAKILGCADCFIDWDRMFCFHWGKMYSHGIPRAISRRQ